MPEKKDTMNSRKNPPCKLEKPNSHKTTSNITPLLSYLKSKMLGKQFQELQLVVKRTGVRTEGLGTPVINNKIMSLITFIHTNIRRGEGLGDDSFSLAHSLGGDQKEQKMHARVSPWSCAQASSM